VNDWLNLLFQAIDVKDVERFASYLGDDVRFRFGSNPAVTGKAEVATAVAGFFASIKVLEHRVTSVWREPDAVICEGEVAYTRRDGRVVAAPFVNVLRMRGGLVRDYRIYVDAAALYA